MAPWLTLDGNPYPAVVDGRVQWIIDGYTTSDDYPYSQAHRHRHRDLRLGHRAIQRRHRRSASGQVNYIRNSVKATVDAYDGSVKLYAWDEPGPDAQGVEQGLRRTRCCRCREISADLMSHLRYPEDLFKVQRADAATATT